jgi:tetratricopeptide (TPR) repeat protein
MRPRIHHFALAALLLGLPAPAVAGGVSRADQAAATALFDEARALFDKSHYEAALAKFEASQRIEPTAGKLLNIARCHEKLGRLASAAGALDEAESLARKEADEARRAYAEQWRKELEPRLARIRFEADATYAKAEIRLDQRPLPRGALDTALPVDPGDHVIEAIAEGTAPLHFTVTLRPEPGTLLVKLPPPGATPPAPPLPAPSSEKPAPPVKYWGAQRIAGVGVGAAGLAGIIVGAVFGVRANSEMAESRRLYCVQGQPALCKPEGLALRNQASRDANIADVGIIAGAAVLGAGVVLFLTAPRPRAERAAAGLGLGLGPGGATVNLQGVF